MSSRGAAELAQLALLGEAVGCLEDVAIFVWDEDRNYLAVNDAGCTLVGRSRDELLRMKVGDMTADRAAPLFDEVQRGGVHNGTLRLDGDEGPVEVEWLTCRTTIAGLPYMVSVCWRGEST